MNTVTPSELKTMLVKMIPARLPVLITGAPGIGKTDIGSQAAELCGIKPEHQIFSHPVLDDPTDIKGFPMRIDNHMIFAPIGDIERILAAVLPTLWFIDDIGQATPSMQAAYMRPILTHCIGNTPIPACVSIIAATNRRKDKAGVSGILEPVKSRFATIVELVPDLQEWCAWAISKGTIQPMLIAFLRFRSELLSKFEATADLTNSPSPRTWYNLSKVESLGLPATLEHKVMAGSVGEGPATEYLAFRKMAASLVSIDAILADPSHAALPAKPSECYAICAGLAMRANDKTIARIGTYITRLAQEGKGEFAAMTVRDCIRKTPTLANTADYINLMCGPVGQLISGQAITA